MTDQITGRLSEFISKNILKKKDNIMPHEVLISSGLVDSFSLGEWG